MAKKQKKWIKPRHAIIQRIAKFLLKPFVKIKYGVTISKCKDNRQRLILSNHQTDFDQFFIAYGFPAPIYYLASEDIFSNGFISKLLRFAVNPIPIKKQTNDIKAVMDCMRVAKEGGTIAIFPEGNRTFSGTTEYISIAIVKLIKALKLPLTFFKIEGGYGVHPRWSNKARKGKMRAYTSKTVEAEEYLKLTDEELYNLVLTELYFDDNQIHAEYKSNKLAEHLERAIYVCDKCGITHFKSKGCKITCTTCGKQIEYLPNKALRGKNHDFKFASVKQWYDYQSEYITKLDIENYFDKPLFSERTKVFSVMLYKRKKRLAKNAELTCYGNKLTVNGNAFLYDKIRAVTVLGRNKLNVYYGDKVLQFKGDKSFNAVKFVNVYYRYQNYVKGEKDGKFLGL